MTNRTLGNQRTKNLKEQNYIRCIKTLEANFDELRRQNKTKGYKGDSYPTSQGPEDEEVPLNHNIQLNEGETRKNCGRLNPTEKRACPSHAGPKRRCQPLIRSGIPIQRHQVRHKTFKMLES